jgi:hypothetical protein
MNHNILPYGKVLDHLGFKSKVLSVLLTDLCSGRFLHLKPTTGRPISTSIEIIDKNKVTKCNKNQSKGENKAPKIINTGKYTIN